jgi:hypothetical protein
MLNNGERALAYVVSIDEIKPIEGYDRVEYARTNGWWVVVSKKTISKSETSVFTSRLTANSQRRTRDLSFSNQSIIR